MKNWRFQPISSSISNTAIVTMKDRTGTLCNLWNDATSNDLQWPLTYISRSQYFECHIAQKWCEIELLLQQQTNIVVYDLSIGAIFNDLNNPLMQISRSRQYSMLNISATVEDRHIYNARRIGEWDLICGQSNGTIFNELLTKISRFECQI